MISLYSTHSGDTLGYALAQDMEELARAIVEIARVIDKDDLQELADYLCMECGDSASKIIALGDLIMHAVRDDEDKE